MSIFSYRSWAPSEAMSAKAAAHIFPWPVPVGCSLESHKTLCSTGAATGLSTEASTLSIHSPVKSGFGTFVPLDSRIRAAHAIMVRSPRTVVRPSVSGWLPR